MTEPLTVELKLAHIIFYGDNTGGLITNYDKLATQYEATVESPPPLFKQLVLTKTVPGIQSTGDIHSDSFEIEGEDNYEIDFVSADMSWEYDDDKWWFRFFHDDDVMDAAHSAVSTIVLQNLIGRSGRVSQGFEFQHLIEVGIGLQVGLALSR